MAGNILIRDTFDGMLSGQSISGRVPPVTESGYAWRIEVNSTANSDGQGGISITNACQQRTLAESQVAVQIKWNDGGSANSVTLYIGDRTASNIYPRTAYGVIFRPRSAEVRLIRIDEYNMYLIGSYITGVSFNYTADVLAFERNGNDFRALVNGVEVGSFTDAAKPPDGTRKHHGMAPFQPVNNAGRVLEFEIFDGIADTAAPSQSYTVVDVQ